MKNLLSAFCLTFLLTAAAAPARASVSVNVTIGHFYDELSPYGHWVTVDRWGECWYPDAVDASWQPYLHGEWIWTAYGWAWVSYDPWGGDPYHYGTWVWDAGYRWVWVPGTVWAPSWVTWSYSDRYVGWAPISPSISFGFSGYSGSYVAPANAYVFAPADRFVGVDVTTVRVPSTRNAAILPLARSATRLEVKGGIVRNTGLSPTQLERFGGKRLAPVSIERAKTRPVRFAASGGRLSVVSSAIVRHAALGARVRTEGRRAGSASRAHEAVARGGGRLRTERVERSLTRAPRVEKHPSRNVHGSRTERVTRHDASSAARRPERGDRHTSRPMHPVVRERAVPVSREVRASRHERFAPPPQLERPERQHAAPPAARAFEPRHAPGPPAERHEPPPQQAMRVERHEAPQAHHEQGPPQAHGQGQGREKKDKH